MGSTTALIITLLLLYSSSAFAQSTKQPILLSNLGEKEAKTEQKPDKKDEKPLDFSDTGRPGQQTAGESRGSCANLEDRVKAVVPVSHGGKTVSSHPSFWVYLPYRNNQISHIEFVLQNEAREDVWRSQIEGKQDIGYKKFTLPKTAAPLKVGQWYRWYIKIYCQPRTASAQYVQSWVKRIPLTSELYVELKQESQQPHLTYGNYGIWYDAVDRLLNEYQRQPTDLELEQDWQNLIKAKGVELQTLPEVDANYEAVK